MMKTKQMTVTDWENESKSDLKKCETVPETVKRRNYGLDQASMVAEQLQLNQFKSDHSSLWEQ